MDLQVQLIEFAVTLFIGIILGVMFDFYRILRGVFRPKQLLTLFGDALYWLAALVVTFGCLLYSNWAQLRFYVFFGITIGAILYYFFISRYIIFSLFYFIRRIIACINVIKKFTSYVIIRPIAYCMGLCTVPFRRSYNIICRKKGDLSKNDKNT